MDDYLHLYQIPLEMAPNPYFVYQEAGPLYILGEQLILTPVTVITKVTGSFLLFPGICCCSLWRIFYDERNSEESPKNMTSYVHGRDVIQLFNSCDIPPKVALLSIDDINIYRQFSLFLCLNCESTKIGNFKICPLNFDWSECLWVLWKFELIWGFVSCNIFLWENLTLIIQSLHRYPCAKQAIWSVSIHLKHIS